MENKCGHKQSHVHEIEGSVRLADFRDEPHNHRFAGITGEVIQVANGHIHKFVTTTDFYEDHYHPICVKTGLAVRVGKGEDARHIHYIDNRTEVEDGHLHEFIVATLIENDIGEDKNGGC